VAGIGLTQLSTLSNNPFQNFRLLRALPDLISGAS